MVKSWGQIGKEAAQKLKGMTDEAAIAQLGRDLIAQIRNSEVGDGQKKAYSMVSRAIRKRFPHQSDERPLYWHDPRGRVNQPKWRHLIFKSFTLSVSEWGTSEYKAASTPQNQQPTADMMSQLQFSSETQQLLDTALAATGMEPMELIRKAIASYAKAIVSKRAIDLRTIPTDKLLNDSSYSTTPGRAEELTKRAIRAIMRYNSQIATETNQRWAITQSIIAALIGGRASNIGKAMKPYQGDIDDHNAKYGINGYTNRSQEQKIDEAIDLAAWVPDGLDASPTTNDPISAESPVAESPHYSY